MTQHNGKEFKDMFDAYMASFRTIRAGVCAAVTAFVVHGAYWLINVVLGKFRHSSDGSGLSNDNAFWTGMKSIIDVVNVNVLLLFVAIWLASLGYLSIPPKHSNGTVRFFARLFRSSSHGIKESILFLFGWLIPLYLLLLVAYPREMGREVVGGILIILLLPAALHYIHQNWAKRPIWEWGLRFRLIFVVVMLVWSVVVIHLFSYMA